MTIRNVCEKKLSTMNGKIIKYNIYESENNAQIHYGIQIVEQIGGIRNDETIKNVSNNKDFVHNLLWYLCENSIDTVHFKDIVEDYLLKSEDTA